MATGPGGKKPFFGRPLHKDWLWWWAMVWGAVSFYLTRREYAALGTSPTLVAFVIDYSLRTVFFLALFVLPVGLARRFFRRRRARRS